LKGLLRRLPALPLVLLIRAYQVALSPLLPASCRFTPSCSQYFLEALREWGLFRGTWLGVRRILRCRPGGGAGFDPVPPREREATPPRPPRPSRES
jgi:putative membrane protein insertion efficiency factor